MSNKELLEKITSIIEDALNRRISIVNTATSTAIGSTSIRPMNSHETLEYLAKRFKELKENVD